MPDVDGRSQKNLKAAGWDEEGIDAKLLSAVADWTALFSPESRDKPTAATLPVVKTSIGQAVAAEARAELRNRNDRLVDKIAGAEEALEPHQFPPSELLRGMPPRYVNTPQGTWSSSLREK